MLRRTHSCYKALAFGSLCFLLLSSSTSVFAQSADSALRAQRFSDYITQAASLCFAVPARLCIEHAFAFADRNGDRGLSPAELIDVDGDVRAWWQESRNRLPAQANFGIGLGLLLAQYAGHGYFVSAWDGDGDGVVSMEELTADLTLDDRPFPVLLQDDEAVDWASVRSRLGQYGSFLDRIRGGS